jgi:hypothetical protein
MTKLLYVMKASSPFICNNPLKEPFSHHGPGVPLDGRCVEGITIAVSEEIRYEMKILQSRPSHVQRSEHARTEHIPYIYKMTILLKPGINHICWCTESTALSMEPGRRDGNDLLMLPRSGYGSMLTYEIQETEPDRYLKYKKLEPLTCDPVRPKAYVFTPNTPPKFITLLSLPGKVPPLWLWAKLGRGGRGYFEMKAMAASFQIPEHLYDEHTRVIRHRKSSNFFYRMASYEGCFSKHLLQFCNCMKCLIRTGRLRLHTENRLPPSDPANRISRPPTCGYLPEDISQPGYEEPVTDESADEDGPDPSWKVQN